MTAFETIALLLTLAALGAYVNNRFLKLPATIGLMVLALLMSLSAIGLSKLGLIDLDAIRAFVGHIDFSALLLHGMLSFLLFAGALHIDFGELKRNRTVVLVLATVSTALAAFITGSLVWLAAGFFGFAFPYIYALLFGALIAPTDPVAVLSILKETSMSKMLRTKIASESLLNDGVGVVLFLVFLNLADFSARGPTIPEILFLLLWEGLGSVALGLSLGWLTYRLLCSIDDYKVEVLLTLALAAGGYSLAEVAHVSGPITMVVAGLVIGNHGRMFGMSDKTRNHLDMFWELLDEILNAILFILIGLEMMVIPLIPSYIETGLLAILATLAGRFISVAIPVLLMRRRYKFEHGAIRLLTWGGLRGGISIALALSLPPGPAKELILAMTYIVVVFSVLFQGTSFRHAIRAIINKT